MNVGRELRRIRETKGLSQTKVAAGAGMSVSGLSQIETGARNPSAVTLAKLAESLEVEVADLFPKEQAPLPFEYDHRRFLPYVRPWFLTLKRFSGRLKELGSPGKFNAGEYLASEAEHKNIMAGLNMLLRELQNQGIDPMSGIIGEELRESMLELASALRVSSDAALKVLTESELAQAKQRRAEAQAKLESFPNFEKEAVS